MRGNPAGEAPTGRGLLRHGLQLVVAVLKLPAVPLAAVQLAV